MIKNLQSLKSRTFLFLLTSCFLWAGLSSHSVFAYEYNIGVDVEQQKHSLGYNYYVKDHLGQEIDKKKYEVLFSVEVDQKGNLSVCGDNINNKSEIPSLSIDYSGNVTFFNLEVTQLYLQAATFTSNLTSVLKADTFQVRTLDADNSSFADGNYFVSGCLSTCKDSKLTLGKNTVLSCGDINNEATFVSEADIEINQNIARLTKLGKVETKGNLTYHAPSLKTVQDWIKKNDIDCSKAKGIVDGADYPFEKIKDAVIRLSYLQGLAWKRRPGRRRKSNTQNNAQNFTLLKQNQLPYLRELSFNNKTPISDKHLELLENLTTLNFVGSNHITSKSVGKLINLNNLRIARDKTITGACFSKLTKLRTLSLDSCTNIIAQSLGVLTSLQGLTLSAVKDDSGKQIIDDENLSKLINLESLSLTNIDNLSESSLATLTKLKELKLHNCNFSHHSLKTLSTLESLSLHDMPNIELTVQILKDLPKLKKLHIRGCSKISEQTIKDIQQQIPASRKLTIDFSD